MSLADAIVYQTRRRNIPPALYNPRRLWQQRRQLRRSVSSSTVNRIIKRIVGKHNKNDSTLALTSTAVDASVDGSIDSTSKSNTTQATPTNTDSSQNSMPTLTGSDNNAENHMQTPGIHSVNESIDVDYPVPTDNTYLNQETDLCEEKPEAEPVFNYFSSANVSVQQFLENNFQIGETNAIAETSSLASNDDDCVLLGETVPAPLPSTLDGLAKQQNDPISGNKPFNSSVSTFSSNHHSLFSTKSNPLFSKVVQNVNF